MSGRFAVSYSLLLGPFPPLALPLGALRARCVRLVGYLLPLLRAFLAARRDLTPASASPEKKGTSFANELLESSFGRATSAGGLGSPLPDTVAEVCVCVCV